MNRQIGEKETVSINLNWLHLMINETAREAAMGSFAAVELSESSLDISVSKNCNPRTGLTLFTV